MRKMEKRIIAILLTIMMIFGMLPTSVMAAISQTAGNSAIENAALLEALKAEYGDDSEQLMAILEQYGLLDKNGNIITDEEIVVDGKSYTLAELEKWLTGEDVDLTTQAQVAGQTVTLGDLKTMIEIEKELARIKATYFTDMELTDEQRAALLSMRNQFAEEGLTIQSASPVDTPSGVDHQAIIKTPEGFSLGNMDSDRDLTVALVKETTENVTFQYELLDGSAVTGTEIHNNESTLSGTGTIQAGQTSVDIPVNLDASSRRWNGTRTLYVKLSAANNAVFENGATSVYVPVQITNQRGYINSTFATKLNSVGMRMRWVWWKNSEEYYTLLDDTYDISKSIGDTTVEYTQHTGNIFNSTRDNAILYEQENASMFLNAIADGTIACFEGAANTNRCENSFTNPHFTGGYISIDGENGSTIDDIVRFKTGSSQNYPSGKNFSWTYTPSDTERAAIRELMDGYLSATEKPGLLVKVSTDFWLGFSGWNTLLSSSGNGSVYATPEVTAITAPAGTYYPGETVPITVSFNVPVKSDSSTTLTTDDGGTLTLMDKNTISDQLTFAYTVQQVDNPNIMLTSLTGVKDVTEQKSVSWSGKSEIINDVKLATPRKADTIDWDKASVKETSLNEDGTTHVRLEIPITDEAKKDVQLRAWMGSENELVTVDGVMKRCLKSLTLTAGTKSSKTENIPVYAIGEDSTSGYYAEFDRPKTDTAETQYIEYYLDPVIGGTNAKNADTDAKYVRTLLRGHYINYQTIVPVYLGANDFNIAPTGSAAEGSDKAWSEVSGKGVGSQDNPYEIFDDEYAAHEGGLQLKLALNTESLNVANATWKDLDKDFAWKVTLDGKDVTATTLSTSKNGEVTLTPTDTGMYAITCTAQNDGVKKTDSGTIYLNYRAGQTTFFNIPVKEVSAVLGQNARINWSSNFIDKNEALQAGKSTDFFIRLYNYDSTKTYNVGSEIEAAAQELSGTAAERVSSVTIPAGYLTKISKFGEFSYTVGISAVNPDTGNTETKYAYLTVQSNPAVVKLDTPDTLCVLDTNNYNFGWTLSDLDDSNGYEFTAVVTDNDTGDVVESWDADDLKSLGADGRYFASFTPEVSDGYRRLYKVELSVRNKAAEGQKDDTNVLSNSWSRDSYVVYVYDDAALKLWIDGEDPGNTATMSNWDTAANDKVTNTTPISKMSQAEIVALKRDIHLENVISINYGDHAWKELTDQIAWKVDDTSVATVNYKQGTRYYSLDEFAYTSYMPLTQFHLEGLKNGKTDITATHKNTGMSDSVTLNVETLYQKLYLFQFNPATKVEVSYTTGDGKPKTVESEKDGQAAIYEEEGLTGAVYCRVIDSKGATTYVYTTYASELTSSEKDASKLELYPVNNINMRPVSAAEFYFKQPDGKPYTGDVYIRGGVYKNGSYCEEAALSYGSQKNIKTNATQALTVKPSSDKGYAKVELDSSQFWNGNESGEDRNVQSSDELVFRFEVTFPENSGMRPLLLELIGSSGVNDEVVMKNNVVTLEKYDNDKDHKQPYVAMQKVDFHDASGSLGITAEQDVRNKSTKIGISTQYPELVVKSRSLWPGYDVSAANLSSKLKDQTNIVPDCQTSKVITYPFSSMPVTENDLTINDSSYKEQHAGSDWLPSMTQRNVKMLYYEDVEQLLSEQMSFRVVNLKNLYDGNLASDGDLRKMLLKLATSGTQKGQSIGVDGGEMADAGIGLLGSTGIGSSMIRMTLSPTSDPTAFRALISMGVNTGVETGDVNADDDDDSEEIKTIKDDNGNEVASASWTKPLKKNELKYLPDFNDLKDLSQGKGIYEDDAKGSLKDVWNNSREKVKNSKGSTNVDGDSNPSFALTGYCEAEIFYNVEEQKWDILIVKGGFTAGGGMGYSWNVNSWCGPVPITASLEVGASVDVNFNAAVNWEEEANDYLTQLRIAAYIRAFAGIGFDYSILALKVGIFGQINITNTVQFLNRIGQSSADVGYQLGISGEVGLEFLIKFLFFNFQTVLASASFDVAAVTAGDWNYIQKYWAEVSAGTTGKQGEAVKPASLQYVSAKAIYDDPETGTSIYQSPTKTTMESRDYLEEYKRAWNTPSNSPISLFSQADTNGIPQTLQSNAYPYSTPVLSEDGSMMAYLDDGNSADVSATRASYSRYSSNSYVEGVKFPMPTSMENEGYGDTQLQIAGKDSHMAAVWSRVTTDIQKDAGASVNNADQSAMTGSTEVLCSIWNGSQWTTTRLTENTTPDLSPVVAVANNGDVFVAWRSALSVNESNPTDFSGSDTILYRSYSASSNSWSAPDMLYNGTSGAVKGMQAAMLSDGSASVAFTLDKSDIVQTMDSSSVNDGTGLEAVMAVIPKNAEGYGEPVTTRLTNDNYVDENPQLTAVKTGSDEFFLLGWHSVHKTDGVSTSDICLRAFDGKGSLNAAIPESISAISNLATSIGADFHFAKNADSLENLSILWSESAMENLDESDVKVDKDVIKAVKFVVNDAENSISLTTPLDVAEMPAATSVDDYDAFVKDSSAGNTIKTVILGTSYTDTKDSGYKAEDGKPISVPYGEAKLYTAEDTYKNELEISAVIVDYNAVKPGEVTPVQATITNLGVENAESVRFTLLGTSVVSDKSLAPGESVTLTAYPTLPDSLTTPVPYQAAAGFGSGLLKALANDGTTTGDLYLNYPDTTVTDLTLKDAENGIRKLEVKLGNKLSIPLNGSGLTVKVGFFSDVACETPISQYVSADDYTLSGTGGSSGFAVPADDYDMIDNYGWSKVFDFNVKKYLNDANIQEIPENGVTVYAKSWLEEDGKQLKEYDETENSSNFTIASVEEPVTVTNTLSNASGTSVVTVTLKNNRLSQTQNGNTIVTLLDEQGNVLEQQQIYDGKESSLITLQADEKYTSRAFTFNHAGVTAEVSYTSLTLDTVDAELSSLQFSNIPGITLDSFVEDQANPGTYKAVASADNLTFTTVLAATKSINAKASIDNGEGSNALSQVVSLAPGKLNTITLKSVSGDGNTTKTYILNLTNNGDPIISLEGNYGTAVEYGTDKSAVIKVIAAKSETDNYTMNYQWYSCDAYGNTEPTSKLENETKDTLNIPATTSPGNHFYRCLVSRSMTDGSTKEYWSSIATVQIKPGTSNVLTAKGVIAEYDKDNIKTYSPIATASVADSDILYATGYKADGTFDWKSDKPGFTDIGAYQVWIKAVKPNYEDTQITAVTVLIQDAPTISEPTVTIDEQYGSQVVYDTDAKAEISITTTKNPPEAAYELTYQWYECDDKNTEESRKELEKETKETLTVKSTAGAGTHYYTCKVTRTQADKTIDYWSSVATVAIQAASGNDVQLTGTTVTFDNKPHGLTEAKASKEGSTLWYSTDYGSTDTETEPTWSTDVPEFTAVGSYTVWVKATNPNYDDTGIKTETILIQQSETIQFKLEIQSVSNAFSSYPDEIKSEYKDADGMESMLKEEIKKLGFSETNTQISDVKLMFTLDEGQNWIEADKENFPATGIRVKLPYPEGTSKDRYYFTVKHLITDPLNTGKTVGDLEVMAITQEEDGIAFTADCLSPFALGWMKRSSGGGGGAGGGSSAAESFAIAIDNIKNGTVTADSKTSTEGKTLTVTTKPADGYRTDAVTVVTADGVVVEVTKKSEDTYTFKMPASAVSIRAVFVSTTEEWKNPFRDVANSDYYYNAVKWAVEKNVTSGTTATTFEPDSSCTRAQNVTFLWRAMGSPEPTTAKNPFTDVSADDYYYKAVLWAAENGVTSGTSATTFSPNDTVSRAQVAAFLWRTAGSPDAAANSKFADVTDPEQYYYKAVQWAVSKEITSGTSETTFTPAAPCTRAQIVTFLYRYSDK